MSFPETDAGSQRIHFPVFAALAGFTAWLLTFALVRALPYFVPSNGPSTDLVPFALFGSFFGATFAAYLWLVRGISLPWRALLITLVATIAHDLAFLAAIGASVIGLKIDGNGSNPVVFEAYGAVAGGVVGALLLGLFAQLIYRRPLRGWFLRTCAATLAGALLGWIGWQLGQPLAAITGAKGDITKVEENANFTSLYVVWQTGMAVVLAYVCEPARTRRELLSRARLNTDN